MKPCKHLDHNAEKYPTAKLIALDDFSVPVQYFERRNFDGDIEKVQFCKHRGRIKGIFQCYNPGEMYCYDADVE